MRANHVEWFRHELKKSHQFHSLEIAIVRVRHEGAVNDNHFQQLAMIYQNFRSKLKSLVLEQLCVRQFLRIAKLVVCHL